jgi:hypothetical protein
MGNLFILYEINKSINITVVPSFGRIVTVPEPDKQTVVYFYNHKFFFS